MVDSKPIKNQNSNWDLKSVVESWRNNAEERMEFLGQATLKMLEMAQIKPGSQILDIAAGTGDQSLIAARLIGSTGKIVATDLSENMLKVAAELAKEEGLTNVTTQVMDAQKLDFPSETFDAVISRHGLMFVPNINQVLDEMYRVLKKDGKFAILVWSKPEKNPAFSIPMSILHCMADMPFPKLEPGMFALSDPYFVAKIFKTAGFQEVEVEAISHVQHALSAKDFLLARKDKASGGMSEALKRLSDSDRLRARTKILEELRAFEGPNGFEVSSESLLVYGMK